MRIFHLFTVSPATVPGQEPPQVQIANYYIGADNLWMAWGRIAVYADQAEASEVWGAEISDVMVTPETLLRQQDAAEVFRHWSDSQERYQKLFDGERPAVPS